MDSLLEPITDTEEHLFCTTMMKRLNIQRRNEQFCDVILEVGSGDDQAHLKAHKNVLSSAGPFFFNALKTDMKEKEEGVIRLRDTSKAVMEKVLDYLYTGHVDINEENAYDLFAQADYLLMPGLKALSSKFILRTLDINNCIMSYYFAIKYQGEELQNGAREFIHANFIAVSGTEEFLNLGIEEIVEWISSDKIIVKEEEEVFQVIVKWMEKNRNADFLQLLRYVRCIYVSRNFVFNVMLQHPLVTASATCTKFILDVMREVTSGTDECFLSQPPRDCLKTHENAIVLCSGKRTFCYLPDQDKWYHLANMRSAHDSYSCTTSSIHNKLLVVGGHINPRSSNAVWYDPVHNEWTTGKSPELVENCAGAATLQGFLYVVGGKDKNQTQLDTVQKYNPDRNQWQLVSPLSSPRSNVCAVADGSYLYAIGGINATGEYLDIVERYDPGKNTWEKLSSTNLKRASASGVANEQVFVFGGLSKESTVTRSFEMYESDRNMWFHFKTRVPPRHFASAVGFQQKIYVFGTSSTYNDQDENEMSLHLLDLDGMEWECCLCFKIPEGEAYHISALRLPRDVLTGCKQLSKYTRH